MKRLLNIMAGLVLLLSSQSCILSLVHEVTHPRYHVAWEPYARFTVVKDGSPEQKKYGENVVVMNITTKKEKTDWAEFLKGLPGVTVDEDGKITVNGRAVTTIMINGRAYSIDTK